MSIRRLNEPFASGGRGADENGGLLTRKRLDHLRAPRAADSGAYQMRKRSKRVVLITGEVVPPGSLRPNPYNRFASSTPEERWESFVGECACIIAEARERAAHGHGTQEGLKDRT
jgi:hypothetical protein